MISLFSTAYLKPLKASSNYFSKALLRAAVVRVLRFCGQVISIVSVSVPLVFFLFNLLNFCCIPTHGEIMKLAMYNPS